MILLDNRTPLDVTTFDAKDLEEKPFQTVVVKGMFCIERDKPLVPRPMMRKLKQSCAAFADLTPQPPLQLRGYAARGEGEPDGFSGLSPLHAAKRSWRGGPGG